ncbi:MAG: hypothetical protein RR386_00315 [Bacteroidaceae bacterium]
MQKFGGDDIDKVITGGGSIFKPARKDSPSEKKPKVKTKAKKKTYITGQHGSGSAKKKAEIRERRANRH